MNKSHFKKIRVGYVATAPFISGSERCLQHIIENIDVASIEPILITTPQSPMVEWAKKSSINVQTIDVLAVQSSKLNLFFTQIKLLFILLFNKIDVVHSNQIWSFKVLDSITRLLKIKRVCHFRDPINKGSKWWLPNPIDVGFFISKHIENEFFKTFPQTHVKHTVTLLDPIKQVEPLTSHQLQQVKKQKRVTFNIDTDRFTFGYIGQIAPVKGVLELLSSLAELQELEWQLIIAGADPSIDQAYINACKLLIDDKGITERVHFLGFIDDIADFYYATDVVAMFSHEEPLGLIPLEAGMHYTPTIANDVGGLPETIKHEESGWLVRVDEKNQVKMTLKKALVSDLETMGANARTLVTTKCDSKKYCEALKQLYLGDIAR